MNHWRFTVKFGEAPIKASINLRIFDAVEETAHPEILTDFRRNADFWNCSSPVCDRMDETRFRRTGAGID
jgi:hypothetical protein